MARTFPRTQLPSPQTRHAEWLSLLDISGPFLSLSVLTDAFPQGIDAGRDEAALARGLRRAYTEEWLPNRARSRPDMGLHTAWIDFVLTEVLEWPENLVVSGQTLPPGLEATLPESGETLRPNRALLDPPDRGGKPRLLVAHHAPGQDLNAPLRDDRSGAKASPATRMRHLLQATGVRLGLVTNGEQWLLVSAAAGEITGFVTWHAYLWLEERPTLQAFRALLGGERFFGVPDTETLEGLLARSAGDQAEVTTQLGDQVRQAIELLVAAVDRADRERNGALLAGIPMAAVYEAAVTTMMRLVFLLFAEDQRPPLFGNNPLYDAHYAVSTLIDDLQEAADQAGEEVLERKEDAWSRLLSVFRLVHGGSDHDAMRLPAYGGSLFDPDRFPFLEGRAAGSDWEQVSATPLPVSNRVVLHILEAIQFLQMRAGRGGGTERRRLSFRALDVEQIGHVYERLLEHTVRRAPGPVLGLHGATKGGVRQEPEIPLADLEAWLTKGEDALIDALAKPTGRSASQLKTALHKSLELGNDTRFLVACDNDPALWARVRPFAGLVRSDRAGRPWVIRDGGLYVTSGTDRRQSGAHYTPRSLTEPIVQYALEPLVYVGPAEGTPRAEWKLRPASALLTLKVCDPAMGSGAFLVQTCRYLAERLVEAWDTTERAGGGRLRVAPDGSVSRGDATEDLLPLDPKERQLRAMQLVTDHCLYGVDVNPLAVEMAKLSLWLVTLQKDRPFTFLDHRLRQGDSLLGIADPDQLRQWSLSPNGAAKQGYTQLSWFNQQVKHALDEATRLRAEIAATPVAAAADADRKRNLLDRAERIVGLVGLGADLLVAAAFHPDLRHRPVLRDRCLADFSLAMDGVRRVQSGELTAEGAKPTWNALGELRTLADALLGAHKPFHWPLEFPEVFVAPKEQGESAGFTAIVGNPPFVGGKQISTYLGATYASSLKQVFDDSKGAADLVAYFFRRAFDLLESRGVFGLVATKSIAETSTRAVALDQILARSGTITRADTNLRWPGESGILVSVIHVAKGEWHACCALNGTTTSRISSSLDPDLDFASAHRLKHRVLYNTGVKLYGTSFIRNGSELEEIVMNNPGLPPYVRVYVNGDVLSGTPNADSGLVCIDFGELEETEIRGCDQILQELKIMVRQERSNQTKQIHETRSWLHWDKRTSFFESSRKLHRILSCTIVSVHLSFVFVDPQKLFAHRVTLFADDRSALFALLQSSIHEVWARATSATLAGSLSYSTSTTFDQFPLLKAALNQTSLEDIGESYHRFRHSFMVERVMGTTPVYNLFHDPTETGEDIARLRDLHADMDHAVAAAYGWTDLDLGHGFHETKQGIRFTISELARREVLDRLLRLNHERYAEEVAQGLHDKGKGAKKRVASGGTAPKQQSLTIERGGEDR